MITEVAPIVTSRVGTEGSHTLSRYLATGGYAGLRKALTMTPEAVHEEVNKASLLGRGGAGFAAGRKWGMLRKSETTYLVVNGDESEPATFKDHLLIEDDPHQIIEGSIICAYAIGAKQAFLYCRGEFFGGVTSTSAIPLRDSRVYRPDIPRRSSKRLRTSMSKPRVRSRPK